MRALIGVAALMLVSCAADAQVTTGSELLARCEQLEKGWRFRSDGTIFVPNNGMQCWGYMSAVFDFSFLILSKEGNKETRALGPTCIPNGVSLVQLIRVFLQYARTNAGHLHEPAPKVVLNAINNSFPCR